MVNILSFYSLVSDILQVASKEANGLKICFIEEKKNKKISILFKVLTYFTVNLKVMIILYILCK